MNYSVYNYCLSLILYITLVLKPFFCFFMDCLQLRRKKNEGRKKKVRIKVCCGNNCGEIPVRRRLSSHFPLEVCSPAITPFVLFQHQSHRKSNNQVYCGGFHSGWLMTLLMDENNQQSWELFIGLSMDVASCGFCATGHISVR